MSDDPNPTPTLRLKPRLRPENPAEAAPALPPPGHEPSAGEMPALRLKSRHDGALVDTAPEPVEAPNSVAMADDAYDPAANLFPPERTSAAQPTTNGTSDQPTLSFQAPPADPGQVAEAIDPSRLKLKPRTTQADASGGMPKAPLLPPPVSLPPVRTAPPLSPLPPPALPTPPIPSALATPMVPPPLPPSANVAPGLPPSASRSRSSSRGVSNHRPENSAAFKAGLWGVGIVLLLLIGGGGFLGFRYLAEQEKAALAPPAKDPIKTSKSVNTVTAKTEPSRTPGNPLVRDPESAAGKAIAKAQAAIAQTEQARSIDDVVDESQTESVPIPRPLLPGPQQSASTPQAADPATGNVAIKDEDRPQANSAFKGFVVNMRVNGVFQGQPGRAFINGRMYHVGEMIDPRLGIRLSRLDSDRKTLHFEDRTGAQMSRRY